MQFIYIADPMCSWCYGFSPEMHQVQVAFNHIPLRLVMGGLRPNNKEKINHMKGFLREHWEQVNARSSQPFNYAILDDPQFIYDTEPPVRAVVTVRKVMPEVEFDFFCEVQKSFYVKNRDTSDVTTFHEIFDACQWKIDRKEFARLFESEELKTETRRDFQFASQLGVRGFPSLILYREDQYYMVSRGFEESASIVKRLHRILNEA